MRTNRKIATILIALIATALAVVLSHQFLASVPSALSPEPVLITQQITRVVTLGIFAVGSCVAAWWALSAWLIILTFLLRDGSALSNHITSKVRAFAPKAIRGLLVSATGAGLVFAAIPAQAQQEVVPAPQSVSSISLRLSAPVGPIDPQPTAAATAPAAPGTTAVPTEPATSAAPTEPATSAAPTEPTAPTDIATPVPAPIQSSVSIPDDTPTQAPRPAAEPTVAHTEVPAPHPAPRIEKPAEPEEVQAPEQAQPQKQAQAAAIEQLTIPEPAPVRFESSVTANSVEPQTEISIGLSSTGLATHPTQHKPAKPAKPARELATGTSSATQPIQVSPTATKPVTKATSTATSTENSIKTTTVKRGDSLWMIAQQSLPVDATQQEIAELSTAIYAENESVIGSDPDLLFPGQELVIPELAPADHND